MKYNTTTEISDSDLKQNKRKYRTKRTRADEQALLQKLKNYTSYWYEYWSIYNEAAREHNKFLYVDQWDEQIRQDRESLQVPTLQFNHVRTMIDGILGQQKKNSPEITVTNLNDDAPTDMIDWRSDLIRQISYASKADEAYQTCYKNMLVCGWGHLRVSIHYENSRSFDQVLKITSNPDYQVAFFDPNATDKHKATGDFCGVYQRISKDDFARDYPNIQNPVSTGQETYFTWSTQDTVTVCDVYYKEYFKKTLCKLSNGAELELAEAKALIDQQMIARAEAEEALSAIDAETEEEKAVILDNLEMMLPPVLEIVQQRTLTDYNIKHVRFIENAILDQTEWPGKLLPIIYVPGNPTIVEGRELAVSFINDLLDPQRLHNYAISDIARSVLNTTKSKWLATEDMVKRYEQAWRQPNAVQGALFYNPDNRVPGGKPEFIDPPPFNNGLLNLQGMTTQEMELVSGRFEEARGQQSNAISGVAIKERIAASNNVVNVYFDNLLSGIEQVGRVCMDLIPHVYGDERQVIVRGPDNMPKTITVNRKIGLQMPSDMEGLDDTLAAITEQVEYDVNDENYDVQVKATGSYDYQKHQSAQLLLELMRAVPQSGPLLADLLAGESDVESAAQAAQRLKILLPEQILAAEEGRPPQPPQPQEDPMVAMEKERTRLMAADLELKQQKIQNETIKNAQEMKIDMAELEIKQEDQAYKHSKMKHDAEMAELKAAVEMEKAAAQIRKG
jgi:hypothetical protein